MIPQRDIRIFQQRAFELYFSGKGQNEVKQMLKEAGGDDQEIESLSQKYAEDFKFFQQEKNRIAKKNAPIDLIVGAILLFGGLLISIISYVFSDHVYVVLYGAIIFGGILFTRAMIAKNKEI